MIERRRRHHHISHLQRRTRHAQTRGAEAGSDRQRALETVHLATGYYQSHARCKRQDHARTGHEEGPESRLTQLRHVQFDAGLKHEHDESNFSHQDQCLGVGHDARERRTEEEAGDDLFIVNKLE